MIGPSSADSVVRRRFLHFCPLSHSLEVLTPILLYAAAWALVASRQVNLGHVSFGVTSNEKPANDPMCVVAPVYAETKTV